MVLGKKTILCVRLRPATGPESLHHHRGQADVTFDLQDVNILKGTETMLEAVHLHPVDHNPEELILTTDGQLKEQQLSFQKK